MEINEVTFSALLCVLVLPLVAVIAVEFVRFCWYILQGIVSGVHTLWEDSGRKRDYEVTKRDNEIATSKKHDET